MSVWRRAPNGPNTQPDEQGNLTKRQPDEWSNLKDQCTKRFGFPPRMWLMSECTETSDAARRWRETSVVEYPHYYDIMRTALETGDPNKLRPFTINGRRIKID